MRIAAARKGSGKEACPAGEAVLTGAYALKCKSIIHTVGPVWRGGGAGEAAVLAACYRNSLLLASRSGFESVAFPNISTGVYGYPRDLAGAAAVSAVQAASAETPSVKRVVFVCFDAENFLIYRKLVDS
jgi:O-acetyl-ADP-ribose deacetylase (regulator of RNase III)